MTFARRLRKAPTDAEEALWQVLRMEFRNDKFRRQVPIGPYVADFLSYSARLVIEADGPVHDERHDRRRDAWFASGGWCVLRLGNDAILTDMLTVKASILAAINGEPRRSIP